MPLEIDLHNVYQWFLFSIDCTRWSRNQSSSSASTSSSSPTSCSNTEYLWPSTMPSYKVNIIDHDEHSLKLIGSSRLSEINNEFVIDLLHLFDQCNTKRRWSAMKLMMMLIMNLPYKETERKKDVSMITIVCVFVSHMSILWDFEQWIKAWI